MKLCPFPKQAFQILLLNAQLFERIRHTVVLTEKGKEVLNYAHQMRKLTQELEESMRTKKTVSGHIRLAMADSLCYSLLRENFDEFRGRFPGITLKIIAAGTEEMFRLLNHNEADAILTLDNHIYNTEYVIVREEKAGITLWQGQAVRCGTGHPFPFRSFLNSRLS